MARGNYDGDIFKLYNISTDGAVGLMLTVFIYAMVLMASSVLAYVYFIHLHQNGRIADMIWRLEGHPLEFARGIPLDSEISPEELEFICSNAKKWSRGGATRRVRLVETVPRSMASGPGNLQVTVSECVQLEGHSEPRWGHTAIVRLSPTLFEVSALLPGQLGT